MLSYKCKNCGGEISVDSSGNLFCGYCGSKYAFQDEELLQYRNFRLQMLNYLRGVHDLKVNGESHEELLWGDAETISFETSEGNNITIRYLYSYDDGVAVNYLAKSAMLAVYDRKNRDRAEDALRAMRELSFPPADVKGLQDCFPRLNGSYELKDGGKMLAFERKENLFPLSMFGSMKPEHVAWVISRMENICCVLNYSSLIHGGFSEDNVWINPFIHHAVLLGGWHGATSMEKRGIGILADQDLRDLRKTADRVLGMQREDAPKEFIQFLEGRPQGDAYSDFEAWDKVIENGFGGRRFAKMDPGF